MKFRKSRILLALTALFVVAISVFTVAYREVKLDTLQNEFLTLLDDEQGNYNDNGDVVGICSSKCQFDFFAISGYSCRRFLYDFGV